MAKKQAAPARASRKGSEPAAPAEVFDLVPPAADADEQLAAEVGRNVVGFLKGLATFFTTARQLEANALRRQAQAKGLTLPTSQEEDELLQRFIKATSAERREVEAHWSITATISKFHRAMTARRAKSTDALEAANTTANGLHNQYVQAEIRRAREEQERLRREAEKREQERIAAELAKAEEEALAREMSAPELSDRERRFVDYLTGPYAGDATGQRAAQQAGYKDPAGAARKLLGSAKIAAAIKAQQEAKAIRDQAAAAAAMPRTVETVPTVAPRVTKVGSSRTYHRAELLDEQALITAILAGTPGIPRDLLRIDTTRLNEYATQLEAKINLWPGVRHSSETKLV